MGADKNGGGVPSGLARLRRQTVRSGETADWSCVDAEKIRGAIAAASLKGGALRFGYTRDGGAYAIGVYHQDEYVTEYVRPSEDIEGYLDGLISDFAQLPMRIASEMGPRSHRKR